MAELVVHPRVMARHPELSEAGVVSAWENALVSAPRTSKETNEHIALGFDNDGRLLEIVAVRLEGGSWLIYHAMTPPSKKTYAELGIERR